MGNIIVFGIIAAAAVYIIRKIYRSFKNNDASSDCCGGGCSSCSDNCGCEIDSFYTEKKDKKEDQ